MKYAFLLLMFVSACRTPNPEPIFNCRSVARTVPDALPLLEGQWKLIARDQGREDLDVVLRVMADSVQVFEKNQLIGAYAWNLSTAPNGGGVTFTSTWGTRQAYLPFNTGSVDVCEGTLRMHGPFQDAGYFFYRRVK